MLTKCILCGALICVLLIANGLLHIMIGHGLRWTRSPRLPLAAQGRFEDDVVLTFRTGSTVLFQRLPIHLVQTLAPHENGEPWEYTPNKLYYSDADVRIGDVEILNVLANVSDAVRQLPDFTETYRRIQDTMHLGQDPASIINYIAVSGNNAWQLDRWKFLPLHGDAYRRFPQAKWHIAMEDDTFMMWNQLVKWLRTKPHDEQKFYGNAATLINGSIPFNHGGSGYVISRGLMKATYGRAPFRFEHAFDRYLQYSCCGDAELSRAFLLSKPYVTLDRPSWEESGNSFRGDGLDKIGFSAAMMCEPFFTLHHVNSQAFFELQKFKRAVEPLVPSSDFVRFVDLWDYMAPSFVTRTGRSASARRRNWRAIPQHTGQTDPLARDADECEKSCQVQGCVVWTFDRAATPSSCRLSSAEAFIGVADPTEQAQSGWSGAKLHELRSQARCAGRLGDLVALSEANRGRLGG
ncbi:unnamed protein product [Parajaminaea phylloscopi]